MPNCLVVVPMRPHRGRVEPRMRGGLACVASAFAFVAIASTAAPQWTPVDAVGTTMDLRAPIASVAVDPGDTSRVYATTGNRLLLSLDGGMTFATLPSTASWEPIAALAVVRPPDAARHPALPRLLVGVGNHFGGLYVSDDGGRSFAPAHFDAYGGPLPLPVKRIEVAEADPLVAYVIAFDGLHRTRDGGRTWQRVAMPTNSVAALAIALSADGGTVLLGTSNGLYRSTSGGDAWTLVVVDAASASSASPVVAAFDSAMPGTAYATVGEPADRSLFRSLDSGATWTRAGPLPVNCCGEFIVRGGMMLAIFGGTVFRSTDGGAQWAMAFPDYGAPNALARDAHSGRVYFGGGGDAANGGVPFRFSDDFGASWHPAVAGLAAATVTDAIAEGSGGALFAIASGRLHRKRDADDGWRDVTPAGTSLLPSFLGRPSFLAPGGRLLMVTGDRFLRSSDDGDTWFEDGASATSRGVRVVALEPGAPNTLYANTPIYSLPPGGGITPYLAESRVQRSTDGGLTWVRIDASLPIVTYDLRAGGGGRLFAYTKDGFWFSADAGGTWRRTGSLPDGTSSVWSRADRPSTLIVLNDAGLYRSDDAGAGFVRIADKFDRDLSFILFDTRTVDDVYAVGRLGQVYASTDGGRNWSQVAAAMANSTTFNGATMSPWSAGTLYAGTGYGVLKMVTRLDVAEALEFFHPDFRHYFVTADPAEAAKLLVGELPPWQPTGRAFSVWNSASAERSATCRFFSVSFAPRSSHFYTPYPAECAQLTAGSTWAYEGIAFHLLMPQGPADARTCPPGGQPLYRAFNAMRDGAPNHRYTTSAPVLDAMVGAGWVMEGEAVTRVFACVPEQR